MGMRLKGRRAIKLRHRRPIKKWKLVVFSVCLAFIMLFPVTMYAGRVVSYNMMNFAKAEVRKVVLQIIANSVIKAISENPEINDFFNVRTNNAGEIELVEYDAVRMNKLLNATARRIRVNLKAVENGTIDELSYEDNALGIYNQQDIRNGVIYEVPIGNALGSPLLANIGPRVPVRLHMVGDVYAFARTELEEYGINNVMVRVFMFIEIRERVQLPLMHEEILIQSIELVSIKMIQGKVPDYYGGGGGGNVSVPIVGR